jgi:hypothetical protein
MDDNMYDRHLSMTGENPTAVLTGSNVLSSTIGHYGPFFGTILFIYLFVVYLTALSQYCYCLRGGIAQGVPYTATITDVLHFPI